MSIILGIVGCAEEKFTPVSTTAARSAIRSSFEKYNPYKVVSGRCPMGGIDIWAIDEARAAGLETEEFPPKVPRWHDGFMPRNIQIALISHVLVNIVVRDYPPGFPEEKKFDYCYHCARRDHIKSGGCWTMHYAARNGRQTELVII